MKALGQHFVHYAMTDLPLKIAYSPSIRQLTALEIMLKYVKPPLKVMQEILGNDTQGGTDIALDVYCSPQALLREFFWFRLQLLTHLMNRFTAKRGICLDFGGGSGVFLPTLRTGFDNVCLVDLNTQQAEMMVNIMGLKGVDIYSRNIEEFDFDKGCFEAIVAADVLEHFQDVAIPLNKIRNWLSDDGILFTSLPTENLTYRLLRLVFHKEKPVDHYHSAKEVESFIVGAGFRRIGGIFHPLWIPILPLFRISAWQKLK